MPVLEAVAVLRTAELTAGRVGGLFKLLPRVGRVVELVELAVGLVAVVAVLLVVVVGRFGAVAVERGLLGGTVSPLELPATTGLFLIAGLSSSTGLLASAGASCGSSEP